MFEKEYLNTEKRNRDRFQVEFNKEERELFLEIQLFLRQIKDSTALKQIAFYGWLAISNPGGSNAYLREKLLINEKNNKRQGVALKEELENKFQTKINEMGWKK